MNKTISIEPKSRARKRKKKLGPMDAKNILLGARVSRKELDEWEQRFLKPGTHRSEVIRGMLKIGRIRKRRAVISEEVQWDYARALLMRGSVSNIKTILKSIRQLPNDTKLEAYLNASKVVQGELQRIEQELDALQLRGGMTKHNPARLQSVDLESYFEVGWGPDDC